MPQATTNGGRAALEPVAQILARGIRRLLAPKPPIPLPSSPAPSLLPSPLPPN